MSKSHLEEKVLEEITAAGIDEPEREYIFAPPRRWRFDFAWPDKKVAIEIQGGIWNGGRHTRGAGYRADIEKMNTAIMMDWKVFQFTANEVETAGYVIRFIKHALNCS
jgi:very-short-patch-repair endonuclease